MLEDCLTSIYTQDFPFEFEVWVVDNLSKDQSALMVENLFPQVKLIKNLQNVGFAKANNQAIVNAQGEYILLLNPDTILGKGALFNLVDYLEQHTWVGAAGSKLLNADGSLTNILLPSANPIPGILADVLSG